MEQRQFIITSFREFLAAKKKLSETTQKIWTYGLNLVPWEADELEIPFMTRKNDGLNK